MTTTTTKADIADALYEKLGGFSKRESADIVDECFEILKNTLSRGEKVKISGFGKLRRALQEAARWAQPAHRAKRSRSRLVT